jgi:transcriptional regulator with XRE-family HTH domain
MDDENKEIGKRIRGVRQRLGLTQEELGQTLGVEKASVSKYEAGAAKRGVPFTFLRKIAAMGQISLEDLTGGCPTKDTSTDQDYSSLPDTRPYSVIKEEDAEYNSGPLKLTRQEEEVIYWLRGMPPDLRDIAAEGVRSVWIMANRRSETQKHSE